jgi:amino acid transporter
MSKVDWQDVARRQSNRVLTLLTIACLYVGWFFAVWADQTALDSFQWYRTWRDPFWFWIGQWIWIVGAIVAGRLIHTILFWGLETPPGSN